MQFYSARAAYTKKEIGVILKNLHINKYTIRTRNITRSIERRYEVKGIDIQQLRESFQSRYILVIKKSAK